MDKHTLTMDKHMVGVSTFAGLFLWHCIVILNCVEGVFSAVCFQCQDVHISGLVTQKIVVKMS